MKQVKDEQLELAKYIDSRLEEKILALPLQFEYLPVQIISKQYTKLNSNHPYRIHYLGPRFTSTHILHKKYSTASNNKQKHYFEELLNYGKYQVQMRKLIQSNYLNEKLQNNHYYRSSIFYRAFEGMNPTLNLANEFIFNSCFEAGNLDCVIKVQPMEYDLFLRIDSNTRGHTQWFYFSVQNGHKTGKVTFNICNLTKPKTLYEQGMRPYVFSKKKFQKTGKTWQQDGENMELIEKKLRYSIIYQMVESLCVFKLSFDYNFTEEDDQVFFAYSIPYTYSQMLKDIEMMPDKIVKKYILGRSLTGVDIPVLHITNHQICTQKKNIFIIGRTHPGESNGSHVLKGFMNFICGLSSQALQLRNKINFIIVPMANPDGVIMGNSRSSASGKDLNREYLNSKKQLYPQVFLIKNLAYKLQKNQGIFMFFDFHGHSRKKNTFFYGPSYHLSQADYYKSRAFAKMVQKINNSFRYYSCSFLISQQKRGTARAVLFQRFKIPYVFTVQSSIGLYYDVNKMKTVEFMKEDWEKMGNDICLAISMFRVAHEQYEEMIAERRRQRQRRKQRALKRGGKDKKFVQDGNAEQEQGPILNKKCLLFDMMQQIKQMPQKNADPEASSDDHDDGEDLEMSKMRQFNNLIIQTKQQKDSMEKSSKVQEQSFMEQGMTERRVQTENEQMQIFKELQEQKKTKVLKVVKSNSFNPASQPLVEAKPMIIPQRRLTSLHRNATINLKTPEDKKPLQSYEGRQNRKSVNFETHRHLVSKQFFPIDRCQIVELPKSSVGIRKDIKKGRVMMDEYLKQKKVDKQQIGGVSPAKSIKYPTNKSAQSVEQKDTSATSSRKFKIEDLFNKRTLSQKRLFQKKSTFSKASAPSNRIFDSVIFSGMEIDNMAMMIRTFNK